MARAIAIAAVCAAAVCLSAEAQQSSSNQTEQRLSPEQIMTNRQEKALGRIVMIRAEFSLPGANNAPEAKKRTAHRDGAGIILGEDQAKDQAAPTSIYVLTAWHVVNAPDGTLTSVSVTPHLKNAAPLHASVTGCAEPKTETLGFNDWMVLKINDEGNDQSEKTGQENSPKETLASLRNSITQATKLRRPSEPFSSAVYVVGSGSKDWAIANGSTPRKDGTLLYFSAQSNELASPETGYSGGGVFDDDWRLIAMLRGATLNEQLAITVERLPFVSSSSGGVATEPSGGTCASVKSGLNLALDDSTAAYETAVEYENSWPAAYNSGTADHLLELYPNLPHADLIEDRLRRGKGKVTMSHIDPNPRCVSEPRNGDTVRISCSPSRRVTEKDTKCICLKEELTLIKRFDQWRINGSSDPQLIECPQLPGKK